MRGPFPVTFLSADHRCFLRQATSTDPFQGWGHWLVLFFLILLPGTDILVWKDKQRVIAGMMLSRIQLPYWAYRANRKGQRKVFFQQMKKEQRRYSSYAVVDPAYRNQGLFRQMIRSLTEPVFMVCRDPQIATSLTKLGAKTSPIKNLHNHGATCYQTFSPSKQI